MRILLAVGIGFLLLFSSNTVFGQAGLDTLGLTGGMGDTVVANHFFEEMKELIKEGKWEMAKEIGEKSKEIYIEKFGGRCKQVANIWHQLGMIDYRQGNYENASNAWNTALNIRLEVLGPDQLDVAASYTALGFLNVAKGLYTKALEYQLKALSIRLVILGPEDSNVAGTYSNLGVAYDAQGEYDKALECYQKSSGIYLKNLGMEHPAVLGLYNNLGITYQSIGDFDKAIECLRQTLAIRLKVLGAEHPDVATTYYSLGDAYNQKGEYDKALEFDQKSLAIRLKTLEPEHPDIASSYDITGITYHFIGEYQRSIKFKQRALAIRLQTLGKEHPDVASSYDNLGVSYESTSEYRKALDLKQNALVIRLKTLGPDHPDVAFSYNSLAFSYSYIEEYEKAIEYFHKALEILLNAHGEQHPDVANIYSNLGDSYNITHKYNEAIYNYQSAINSCQYKKNNFQGVNSMQKLVRALNKLSTTQQKQYIEIQSPRLLSESYSNVLQALDAINYQQSTFTDEGTKSHWQTKSYPIYEQAISVSLLKAEVDKNDTLRYHTFTYAEKSKASLLQAQIKAADAINFAGIPDSLLQKEHDLRIDITWREKQRQSLLDKGLTETDTNTLRISSIIFDLKHDYEALKKRFETQYPAYYRLKYDLSTISLPYVQDTLLQPKQALLEYFVGDSIIYIFVARPDTMIVREVKRNFPLEDWIEQFRQGLYGFYTAPKADQTDALYDKCLEQYLEYAPKLYEKLFAPVKAFLPEQVIVVPDGPLGYVPFDALLTAAPKDPNNFKQYPYLLDKHQFSYTYSATLLKEMRDKQHHHEPTKEFVAFAPFYDGDTTLLATMYTYDDLMRKDMQPLAYSGAEVAAASKMMHGEIVAGASATEERFTSMAGDYRILHLATHGRADNRVGDYAFLAFTEIKDSIENELLYVKDLYNLELNADLVVLSACETGIGKLQRGEGIISLARAFAHAGAKSIITTLWEVNDKSTSEQMRYFYRELKRGKTKDEALRLARKRYFSEQSVDVCHPFFWAAFVPVGDMRAVQRRR